MPEFDRHIRIDYSGADKARELEGVPGLIRA